MLQGRFEFGTGAQQIAQLIIGARHVQARTGVIRIDRQHPLESKRCLVRLAAIQRGDTQQIIKAHFAGTFELERLQQSIGIGRFAAFDQRIGIAQQFFSCAVVGLLLAFSFACSLCRTCFRVDSILIVGILSIGNA